jgi:uncharacterized damage-inducible protein DinB
MLEPWLRGTLTEIDAVRRQVLHALELASEDAERWCAPLSDGEMTEKPFGAASVCFHLRHIVRSLDRLLTYAEARQLSVDQLSALASELDCDATTAEAMREFRSGMEHAAVRVRTFDPASYEEKRGVGRQRLPTTVGGLLIHCAEHTQRHIGQAITTAQIVAGIPKSVARETGYDHRKTTATAS